MTASAVRFGDLPVGAYFALMPGGLECRKVSADSWVYAKGAKVAYRKPADHMVYETR